MNKNSVIGFILIFVIFFGFTWYQSRQYEKQVEYQAQQDSIARAQQAYADSLWLAEHPEDTLSSATAQRQRPARGPGGRNPKPGSRRRRRCCRR